jgi:hypothetical protein
MDADRQSGFGLLELLAFIFVVFLILGAGTIVYFRKYDHNTSSTTSNISSSSTGNSGIYGIVTNGGCPGAQKISGPNNCFRAPEAGMRVVAKNMANNLTVTALTNSKGYYQIMVKAGTYSMNANPTKSYVIAQCQNVNSVVVYNAKMTQQNFNCSNGLQ